MRLQTAYPLFYHLTKIFRGSSQNFFKDSLHRDLAKIEKTFVERRNNHSSLFFEILQETNNDLIQSFRKYCYQGLPEIGRIRKEIISHSEQTSLLLSKVEPFHFSSVLFDTFEKKVCSFTSEKKLQKQTNNHDLCRLEIAPLKMSELVNIEEKAAKGMTETCLKVLSKKSAKKGFISFDKSLHLSWLNRYKKEHQDIYEKSYLYRGIRSYNYEYGYHHINWWVMTQFFKKGDQQVPLTRFLTPQNASFSQPIEQIVILPTDPLLLEDLLKDCANIFERIIRSNQEGQSAYQLKRNIRLFCYQMQHTEPFLLTTPYLTVYFHQLFHQYHNLNTHSFLDENLIEEARFFPTLQKFSDQYEKGRLETSFLKS